MESDCTIKKVEESNGQVNISLARRFLMQLIIEVTRRGLESLSVNIRTVTNILVWRVIRLSGLAHASSFHTKNLLES